MQTQQSTEPDVRRRRILGMPLVAMAATAAGSTLAQAASAATPVAAADGPTGRALPSAYDEPLGIGIEGWPYPGPVKMLPLVAQGQPFRMAYMDFAPTGASNGRAIFLLHGKNFDGSYWSGPIQWLRAAGFRVVVPDQIGFNKSAKPDVTYTFEFLAHNTMALADHLGLQTITVMGQSTGGMLAVRMTSMYESRIDKLVLEDPIGLVDYRLYIEPQTTERLVQTERDYTVESYRKFVAHFFPILPPEQYEPFVEWRMRVANSSEFERFALATALTYKMIYQAPVLDLYPTLKLPVLMTAGESDHSIPMAPYATPAKLKQIPLIAEAAQKVIKTVPNGELKLFPRVGHVPHMEVPDAFREAVLSFL